MLLKVLRRQVDFAATSASVLAGNSSQLKHAALGGFTA